MCLKPLRWVPYNDGYFGNGMNNYLVLPVKNGNWKWSQYNSGTWYFGREDSHTYTLEEAKEDAQLAYQTQIGAYFHFLFPDHYIEADTEDLEFFRLS